MPENKIVVLGAGSFGTALAHIYAQKGLDVTLWGRNQKIVDGINHNHINPVYLSSVVLAPFTATTDLKEAVTQKDMLVFAIPTQYIRALLGLIQKWIPPDSLLVNTAKGIEQSTLMVPSQIFADVLGVDCSKRYVILSGPTFALELAQGHPSGMACASKNREVAKQVQELLSTDSLRLYTGSDVMGVELGGALKNVMAIGTGITEGLGFGLNTRAGLITRGLNEMTRLGTHMGANPLTFSGLSGVGDLVLTCTGDLSRNRYVGLEIGRGKKLKDVLAGMQAVAEGVTTADSVYQLMQKTKVDMPNSYYVYKILYENLPPREALKQVLSRELKDEMNGFQRS